MDVYERIEHVADEMKRVEGVAGVVLFGSYSRGEQDEWSDIDLVTIFRDQETLKKNQEEIYKITAKSDLFLQAITLTLEELKESQLLESIIRNGKAYHANKDLETLLNHVHKPYALITYKTANLKPKERVTFTQKLLGRGRGKYRYKGMIHELNGYKVGRGVVIIPTQNVKRMTEYLERENIDYIIRYVWMGPPVPLKASATINSTPARRDTALE